MIIKLIVLDDDQEYVRRFATVCRERYADKLEISFFSSADLVSEALEAGRCDLVLAGERIEAPVSEWAGRLGVARLTDTAYEGREGIPNIFRYQCMDRIYRELLALYVSRSSQELSGLRQAEGNAEVIAVTAPSGGIGASSAAAGLALWLAGEGRSVIYLDLEPEGDAELYFRGDGREGLTELIYALKSQENNLSLRVESILRQDPRGVRFFASCRQPMERSELTGGELERLLIELCSGLRADTVVLDVPFSFGEVEMTAFRSASRIVMLHNGSTVTQRKFSRICEGLHIMGEDRILRKMVLAGNLGGVPEDTLGLECIGRFPCYQGASVVQVPEAMAEHTMWKSVTGAER